MDRILIVDFMNQVHRANITFGRPVPHVQCSNQPTPEGHFCHKLSEIDVAHCACGARWHAEDFCYGWKYNLIYNFFRNLRPLVEQFSPDKCFVVLEGHPAFRYELLSTYKNSRIAKKKTDNNKFHSDQNEIVRLLQYLPITIAKASNYECDDVIGSLCRNMKDEDITILSSDTDFIQLLQLGYKSIQVYNPIKKTVHEAPEYSYLKWKVLAGDKTDDIPSILKPKKALEIAKNQSLFDKFISVEENREAYELNLKLIELYNIPEEEIVFQEGIRNFDLLKKEFAVMDFQSIIGNDNTWSKYMTTFDCIRF